MNQLAYASAIIENIDRDGLLRYDPNDIDKYYAKKIGHFQNDWKRKVLRLSDIFFPLATRKALHCEKTINATTYYHLGMACLCREAYQLPVETTLRALSFGESAVEAYYQPDSGLWVDSGFWVSFPTTVEKAGPKSMHMHGLARLNIMLLAMYRQYQREDFLDISVKSCSAVIKHHNINYYSDHRASISYYYNTTDNTLNINAEFLQWLADIPQERRPKEATALGHQILRMLLMEQNADGSFFYQAIVATGSVQSRSPIDHHHTAYMLNNLLQIMESDFPTEEERQPLIDCCIRGMDFFLTSLYREEQGAAIYAIDTPRCDADAVSYGESLITLCSYLRWPGLPDALRVRIRRLMPLALSHMLQMINLKTGAATSEIVFGKKVCLNSIRWGNGPALQAIFAYTAAERDGLLDNASK